MKKTEKFCNTYQKCGLFPNNDSFLVFILRLLRQILKVLLRFVANSFSCRMLLRQIFEKNLERIENRRTFASSIRGNDL